MKDLFIYGGGVLALSVIGYGVGCSLNDYFRGRKEDMKLNRAIRLGREAHSYEIEPLSEGQLEEMEDWGLMVDTSADPQWIEDGIELLSLHATWAQKPGDELEEAA